MIKRHKKSFKITLEAFAESEGFEPPVPLGTPVFKTGAFDHSANSLYPLLFGECKRKTKFFISQAAQENNRKLIQKTFERH